MSTTGTGLFGSTQTSAFNLTSTAQPTASVPTNTVAPTNFSLGTTTTTTQSGITFGIPRTSGQNAQQLPSFGGGNMAFGTGMTASATSASSLPAATTSLFTGFGTPTATSQPTLNTGFSLSTPTSTTSQFSLGFSSQASSSTAFTLGAPSTSGQSLLFKPTAVSATGITGLTAQGQTSTSVGLGGVDHLTAAAGTKTTVTSVKDSTLPPEIEQTVTSFRNFMKEQKSLSSEIARASPLSLSTLSEKIQSLSNILLAVEGVVARQKLTAEHIKIATINGIQDLDITKKISDNTISIYDRGFLIKNFFLEKVIAFENEGEKLKHDIDDTYRHLLSLSSSPEVTAEQLKIVIQKLHDSFIAISGKLYSLHNDIQLLKVHHKTLRSIFLKDTDRMKTPLEERTKIVPLDKGLSPFSGFSNTALNVMRSSNNPPSPFSSPLTGTAFGSSFGISSDPFSSFGSSPQSQKSFSSQQHQFQLQRPPVGSKRGKR